MHARRTLSAAATALVTALAGTLVLVPLAPASAHEGRNGHGGDRWHHHHGAHMLPGPSRYRREHHPEPPHPESGEGTVQPVATGLNQPKKLTATPDGNLIVALSGDGVGGAGCSETNLPPCLDNSGAIDKVTPSGQVTTLIGGLPSVGMEGSATGPVEARWNGWGLDVLFQNTNIDPKTGEQSFGPGGALLGDLVRFSHSSSPKVLASFGPFEAANNPDHGAGTGVELGLEAAIDSDPYSFVPYRGGYAVADAAANDLLWVSPAGKISVLAVFPTIPEVAAPGTLGPTQTTPVSIEAQAVPDSVAVGPDGALYVGELGGEPFNPETSSVYRVVPGHAPTVFANGFTAIGDIAFDRCGRLLVLEIDQKGLGDAFSSKESLPSPGAIIGVHRDGTKQVLASTGLEFPTGIAITLQGRVYVSNFGVISAAGPGGLSGQVARVTLPASWEGHSY